MNVSGFTSGRLGSASDSDWFRTYLVAGTEYRLGMLGTSVNANLALRGSTGSVVSSVDAKGLGEAEWIFFTPSVSGVYFVDARASAVSATGTGLYSLLLLSNAPDDVDGSSSSDSRVAVGATVSGSIEIPADADFHGANLIQGRTYQITLGGMRSDGMVKVFDSFGSPMGASGEGSVVFTPTLTDTYFFEVSGKYLTDVGGYQLSVREQPKPTISAESVSAWEGNGNHLVFTLRLSAASATDVSVQFETVDEAARAGVDYQAVYRTVVFPAGSTAVDVRVPLFGNTRFEPARDLTVRLSSPVNAQIDDSAIYGSIFDDDTPAGLSLPSDPYAAFQWHLYAVRAQMAWPLATGKGIKIGVFDQGIDRTNPDLSRNTSLALGINTNTLAPGGAPVRATDNHGTAVAGVIAAARDGQGVVGVAYDATLVSLYSSLQFGAQYLSEITNAFRYAQNVDVLNNSWGFGNLLQAGTDWAFLDNTRDPAFAPAFAALRDLASQGRKGLGTVVVQAAGNNYSVGDDTNLHNFQNSRYIITVGATDSAGHAAPFTSTGASVLVSAPGGAGHEDGTSILTTDRSGSDGDWEGNLGVADGTSFSAPIVSGVVALMLEANPRLGYRDVQQILAQTARKIDVGLGVWKDNGATNWNGGGMHFNALTHATGFGQVDALAAVRLAAAWDQPAHTSANVKELTLSKSVLEPIPDGKDGVFSGLNVTEKMVVERVDVTLNIEHSFIGDLAVLLLSPSGTTSFLMYRAAQGALSAYGSSQDDVHFTFNTVLSWGESSLGTWTLGVFDQDSGATGRVLDWSLKLIGSPESADDVHVYTDEYPTLVAKEPGRAVLRDPDGGVNTLNLAALSQDSRVDLSGQSPSTLNGAPFSINSGVVIGILIGGAGDDELMAGYMAATLRGGPGHDILRGSALNDRLEGGAGNDTLWGGAGLDLAVFNFPKAQATISRAAGNSGSVRITGPGGEADDLSQIERLEFSDRHVALDLSGAAGSTARLVGALFGPTQLSNPRLVGEWLAVLDSGVTLQTAVGQAVSSSTFLAAAGTRSNTDFVKLVYKNVVGQGPDAASLAHYAGLLDQGVYSQSSLALLAVELDLTGQQIDLVGLANHGLEYFPGG